jgi:uncharacterized membrane protein
VTEQVDTGEHEEAENENDEEYEQEGQEWEPAPAVPTWWPVTALVLSVLGFADALYLTIEHFQGSVPICSSQGVIDCAKVTTSAESYLLHVPVALLGLLFFSGMVVLNLPPLWRIPHPSLAWARLAMVSVGLVMVVYLVHAEVFVIKAICLWCTGVHVITVVLFVLVLATFPAVLAAARAAAADVEGEVGGGGVDDGFDDADVPEDT